jgi:hypothetical protein
MGVNTPGPGTYDFSKFATNLKSAARVRIGTSSRDTIPMSARDVPGPERYSTEG